MRSWPLQGRGNSGYKIAWIILIMAFPIFGAFYLMPGGTAWVIYLRKRMDSRQQQADILQPNMKSCGAKQKIQMQPAKPITSKL